MIELQTSQGGLHAFDKMFARKPDRIDGVSVASSAIMQLGADHQILHAICSVVCNYTGPKSCGRPACGAAGQERIAHHSIPRPLLQADLDRLAKDAFRRASVTITLRAIKEIYPSFIARLEDLVCFVGLRTLARASRGLVDVAKRHLAHHDRQLASIPRLVCVDGVCTFAARMD